MLLLLFLGFSSGLPLALSGGTLQAWLAVSDVDIKTIGLLGLVGLPYTIKFLWAPVMDRYVPSNLGRRKTWLLITQILLVIIFILIGLTDPKSQILLLAALAFGISFLSASQDIAFDAFRADSLTSKQRGAGAALSVLGYRIAMLVSGAMALVIADIWGFQKTYYFMAFLMCLGIASTLAATEPKNITSNPKSLREAIVMPFREFFGRNEQAMLFIFLVILYKLGDAFAGSLTTAFLLKGPQFSLSDVGMLNKTLGIISTIIGALYGGALLAKIGLFKSLLMFGILQAISNLSFVVLAYAGKSYAILIFAVGFENLSGGMGTAAFVAFLMSLCNKQYSATQFALLSAASAIGRVFVTPIAGFLVSGIGWGLFFFITTLFAIPGLILLYHLRKHIVENDQVC